MNDRKTFKIFNKKEFSMFIKEVDYINLELKIKEFRLINKLGAIN